MSVYYGQTRRGRLDGTERTLDAVVGVIVLVAEVLIGYVALTALYDYGAAASESGAASIGALETGMLIALVGSGLAFLITTIVFLARLATARRSWGAPAWGLALLTAACIIGYLIMTSA